MSEFTAFVIIALLRLQLQAIAIGGAFILGYKFYRLLKSIWDTTSKELKQGKE